LLSVLIAIGVTASSLLIPSLRAQTLTDEVHVSPRRQAGEDKSSEDLSSKVRGKPIKVDVHLVLLPVTIPIRRAKPSLPQRRRSKALPGSALNSNVAAGRNFVG
jgi:hypothetical protein